MKALISLIFSVALVMSVSAQDAPIVEYVGKRVNRRVVEISNMLGQVQYMECKRVVTPVIGKIVKRDFEEDEVTIASFIVADARDKRIPINLNDAQVGLLGHYTNTVISELLARGNRVQVWMHQCSGGGSGIFDYAERVKVL